MSERRVQILNAHDLSKARRCELLGLSRSTAYYRPSPVSEQDLALMRLIDEIHLEFPFYGSRRIRDELDTRGQRVNRKRVQRLMREMGIRALYPKRRTSTPGKGHKIYPYLLRDMTIARANQVWSSDICYIPMARGFMYLVAIMDWHTRKVLACRAQKPYRRLRSTGAVHSETTTGEPGRWSDSCGTGGWWTASCLPICCAPFYKSRSTKV